MDLDKDQVSKQSLSLFIWIDLMMFTLSWWGLYYFRFQVFSGQEGLFSRFAWAYFAILFLTGYFFSREDLYSPLLNLKEQVWKILRANFFVNMSLLMILYFAVEEKMSRVVIGGYFLVSTLAVLLGRALLSKQKGISKKVLAYGDTHQLREYLDQKIREGHYNIVAWLNSGHEISPMASSLASQDNIEKARKKFNPDEIVIGTTVDQFGEIQNLLKELHNDVIPIKIIPDLPFHYLGYQLSEDARGIPLLKVNSVQIKNQDLFLKRVFDFLFAFFVLLLLAPGFLILSILVKLSSPGPIFFGQERVGLDGKKFLMWKFRSMRMSSESEATWTVENDPRRTKIGTFLRKASLDELPQFWNVLMGDMSVVGPRPEQPRYVEKFKGEIQAYMLRHKMKAGITGWAQVNGWRGDTSLEKRIEYDLYYIRNWSLIFDLKIIFLTILKGFINRNAY